jgi:hypothetical protein
MRQRAKVALLTCNLGVLGSNPGRLSGYTNSDLFSSFSPRECGHYIFKHSMAASCVVKWREYLIIVQCVCVCVCVSNVCFSEMFYKMKEPGVYGKSHNKNLPDSMEQSFLRSWSASQEIPHRVFTVPFRTNRTPLHLLLLSPSVTRQLGVLSTCNSLQVYLSDCHVFWTRDLPSRFLEHLRSLIPVSSLRLRLESVQPATHISCISAASTFPICSAPKGPCFVTIYQWRDVP